jgi:hypothetical protein
MNIWLAWTPMSWIAKMFGCERAAIALASRSNRVRQHFDGDVAAEAVVVRAIDLAHPAGADRAADPTPAPAIPHRGGVGLAAGIFLARAQHREHLL